MGVALIQTESLKIAFVIKFSAFYLRKRRTVKIIRINSGKIVNAMLSPRINGQLVSSAFYRYSSVC